ncbi:MAG: Smr/MutS family protein [Chitinophagaceae bacterium]|nr:Smr/MutS family protein [Chitinophagaceae bacterium]
MKYQIGDRVLILHSNEEADIIDIINEKMLMVDVKGVSFPVYMDQVDFPYFKRFTEKKSQPFKKDKKYVDDLRKEKPSQEKRQEDGVWLSFLPVMDTDEFGDLVVEELKIHLLNHTSQPYLFTYQLHYFGKPDLTVNNTLHPFEDFYLQDIPFSYLNDSPSFEFEFRLPVPDKKKAEHFESLVRLKPKQLFARIEELKQKNLASFTQLLFERYPDRAVEDLVEPGRLAAKGYKVYEASKARQHLEPARSVVDLHIEKLSNDWKGLSNYEILDIQLKAFEKFYHLAVVHHFPSMIVIHGVGEGVLRDEIHDILRLKKEVGSFVNQYHPAYGFGATEIFFKS